MRLGSSLTSRSFEKERRSRDARRANVTPIRRDSNCGDELRAGLREVQTAATRSGPGDRARVGRNLEVRRARTGRHGHDKHSHSLGRLPITVARRRPPLADGAWMFGAEYAGTLRVATIFPKNFPPGRPTPYLSPT